MKGPGPAGNRRQDLESQLVTRKEAEDAAAKVHLQRQNAHQELLTVASLCAVPQAPEAQLAANGNRIDGTVTPGPSMPGDAEIRAEDPKIDAKIKSICRGC